MLIIPYNYTDENRLSELLINKNATSEDRAVYIDQDMLFLLKIVDIDKETQYINKTQQGKYWVNIDNYKEHKKKEKFYF